jgi:hypothetical protein
MAEEQSAWVRQGFEGPSQRATAEKALHDAISPDIVGNVAPERGLPPMPWSRDGSRVLFAVWVRPDALLPCPDGMIEADPALVGRLVGA